MRSDAEFAEFVGSSAPRLLHTAYLFSGDRHQAEDDVQTALARTYAAWSGIRNRDPHAYTRKVLVNLVIDRWRRPLREDPYEQVPERPVPEDFTRGLDHQGELARLLDQLTPRERAIVVLRHYHDLPEAEVAAELNISLGTVKSTNSRALAKLRVSTGQPVPASGGAR
ncbi:SigE family RNA polymerase sigma factor [Kutzneria albida]|uniref:SigE family RNA polymerase sigma factor n=1 Tax=Kutzneria albida TaxID=43357 RepID=UPI00046D2893|nr:SigE family RNA polymerase sigma factor [Kutzneria albida]